MTSAAVLKQSGPRHLLADDISYIALEGGGGKGFAYLGALQILEKLNVFDHVIGYAGASAGAITSLMLSLGYRSDEMAMFMKDPSKLGVSVHSFTEFFEPPEPRYRPRPGQPYLLVPNPSPGEEQLITALDHLGLEAGLSAVLVSALGCVLGDAAVGFALAELAKNYGTFKKQIDEHQSTPPFDLLIRSWRRLFVYMGSDMGLFSGRKARDVFDELVGMKVRNTSGIPKLFATFEDLFAVTGKKLLVTGSNLSTGTTQLFSVDHTPAFPVADAIRISMSLPFIYKPYVIDKDIYRGKPPCGTYVDGGVWNNLPFREFDGEPDYDAGTKAKSAAVTGARPKPKTLGLRLAYEPAGQVTTFGQFGLQVARFGLFGSGESQVLSQYTDQTIVLDTEGLDLVDFAPPEAAREAAIKRARRTTRKYFGLPADPKDADELDDIMLEGRKSKTSACQ